ncbi:MAG: glycosyltransferase family 1 protein [Cyanobacteria bacterium J06648_1]
MSNIPKVFFFTAVDEGKADNAYFQDLIINLATGMQQLGIKYYASNNYWRLDPQSDRFLLESDPDVTHHDCDVVVVERQWYEKYGALPEDLFLANRQYKTVYLDCEDGIAGIRTAAWLPEFRQFDFILRTHYANHTKYPPNVYPWAFGLSARVLQELAQPVDFQDKQPQVLVNFRHKKFTHSLRRYVQKHFVPQLEQHFTVDTSSDDPTVVEPDPYHYLQWVQTGRRHYPSYYRRLQESAACACFGGFFLAPGIADYQDPMAYYSAKIIGELGIKTKRIGQWDSWRFWESMVAGCITLHVDFEKYGFELPVMPENWKHYVGIDLDNIAESIARIAAQPELLKSISATGRDWAIKHYAPQPTAIRFLETVSDFQPADLDLLSSEVQVR